MSRCPRGKPSFSQDRGIVPEGYQEIGADIALLENTTLELKVLWRVRNSIREKNARDPLVRKAEG